MTTPPRMQTRLALHDVCPDCNAVNIFTLVEPGCYFLIMNHDPTCPRFQAILAKFGGGS